MTKQLRNIKIFGKKRKKPLQSTMEDDWISFFLCTFLLQVHVRTYRSLLKSSFVVSRLSICGTWIVGQQKSSIN